MKKLIALAIALVSSAAFAQKHMVTFSGFEKDNNAERSIDLSSYSGSDNGSHQNKTNLALNYAYAVTDSVQVGLNFQRNTSKDHSKKDGNGFTKYGIQAIYNYAHKLTDTCYTAIKYDMAKMDESQAPNGTGNDDDKINVWTLEQGHRFSIGNVWGMNLTYSPSVSLAFSKTSPAASGADDQSSTTLKINAVKFDLLF